MPSCIRSGSSDRRKRGQTPFLAHRKWPYEPHIRDKCLVYAVNPAHYATDLCQPPHTTIHYDGRAQEDGSSPHTGIRQRVDGLLRKPDWNRSAIRVACSPPERFGDRTEVQHPPRIEASAHAVGRGAERRDLRLDSVDRLIVERWP